MTDERLKTCVSGSFKFKPEIDQVIDEFEQLGVEVLEPTKGWLWTPTMQIAPPPFRPLPSEIGMDIGEIEDRFLAAAQRSDFLYVYTQHGYVGTSTALEIGSVILNKPVYTSEPIAHQLAEGDLEHISFLESTLIVAGVADAVRLERERLDSTC